jgi:hypothetical protein
MRHIIMSARYIMARTRRGAPLCRCTGWLPNLIVNLQYNSCYAMPGPPENPTLTHVTQPDGEPHPNPPQVGEGTVVGCASGRPLA